LEVDVDRHRLTATGFVLFRTLGISLAALAHATVGRLTVERADDLLQSWARKVTRLVDLRLEVSGLDQVPRDRACIYMSNHQSLFDVPILFAVFPGTLRMVAKTELFAVPIFGRAMRKAGFVPVDRSGNREKARVAMQMAADALRRGINVWLAPEGTRSPDGRIGAFKKGGFFLARETGAAIVPIAIDGSHDILPKHETWIRRSVRVRVAFGAPIGSAGQKTTTLMNQVRDFLAAHVHQPEGEAP
jgi:1-acyl-sn-glycerol-3-phosphate acyltransferase